MRMMYLSSSPFPPGSAIRRPDPSACVRGGALLLVGMLMTGRSLAAQASFLHPLRETPVPVHYETYTAGGCLAAVKRVGAMARRENAVRPDAWQQSFLENDTVLVVQRQTATACVAHLAVTTTPARDWPDLTRVYWFAGDTDRMTQAMTRRLARDTTDSARAMTYFQFLTLFLLSGERDVALAKQRILPGLDSLTSLTAEGARVQAHAALAYTFASSRRPGAGDSTQAQIALALHSYAAMPAIEQTLLVDTIGPLFELGASEATERGDTARAQALLAIARRSLAHIESGANYVHNTEAIVRYFGMLAPAIHADFVYGAGPHASPAGSWPRPGRWTLVSPLPTDGYLAGFYRHLRAVVGNSLELVFVDATRGHWEHRGPLTPAQEGREVYDYLSRRWGIPGILLEEARIFHALSDGRRTPDPTLTPSLYENTGLVIDPQGTIRAMVQPSTLVRFDLLLTALMRRSVAGGAA
jgi:hypothetical protein